MTEKDSVMKRKSIDCPRRIPIEIFSIGSRVMRLFDWSNLLSQSAAAM